MKSDLSVGCLMVFIFGIIIAAMIGWVMNIITLATCGLAIAEWTVMEIMRVIGIFIPIIGAVLGYI